MIPDSRALWLARQICPHEPALRRWLGRRLVYGLDLDDIVQEAYAKLVTVPSVDHITNPRAYFFRTALNILVNEVRRTQVVSIEFVAELDRLEVEADGFAPDIEAEYRQELRHVAEAIAQLPAKCREVFIVRKVHGLSQRETARKLGIAESTVEKHVAKGLRHLVDYFGHGGKTAVSVSRVQSPESGEQDHSRNQRSD